MFQICSKEIFWNIEHFKNAFWTNIKRSCAQRNNIIASAHSFLLIFHYNVLTRIVKLSSTIFNFLTIIAKKSAPPSSTGYLRRCEQEKLDSTKLFILKFGFPFFVFYTFSKIEQVLQNIAQNLCSLFCFG